MLDNTQRNSSVLTSAIFGSGTMYFTHNDAYFK